MQAYSIDLRKKIIEVYKQEKISLSFKRKKSERRKTTKKRQKYLNN
jgi:predicted RNA-binding protein with RPS1 domain